MKITCLILGHDWKYGSASDIFFQRCITCGKINVIELDSKGFKTTNVRKPTEVELIRINNLLQKLEKST
jgi:hypothetical protein